MFFSCVFIYIIIGIFKHFFIFYYSNHGHSKSRLHTKSNVYRFVNKSAARRAHILRTRTGGGFREFPVTDTVEVCAENVEITLDVPAGVSSPSPSSSLLYVLYFSRSRRRVAPPRGPGIAAQPDRDGIGGASARRRRVVYIMTTRRARRCYIMYTASRLYVRANNNNNGNDVITINIFISPVTGGGRRYSRPTNRLHTSPGWRLPSSGTLTSIMIIRRYLWVLVFFFFFFT